MQELKKKQEQAKKKHKKYLKNSEVDLKELIAAKQEVEERKNKNK